MRTPVYTRRERTNSLCIWSDEVIHTHVCILSFPSLYTKVKQKLPTPVAGVDLFYILRILFSNIHLCMISFDHQKASSKLGPVILLVWVAFTSIYTVMSFGYPFIQAKQIESARQTGYIQ